MNFLGHLKFRLIIYAVVAVAVELTVYGIYMATETMFWFLVLENLNVMLFPRIYTWQGWMTWGMLGMFLFVTLIGEISYRTAKTLIQLSTAPESPQKNKNMRIVTFALGLVVGLGLGIAVSSLIIMPKELLCITNPVEVSGTISGVSIGSIQFINEYEAENTRYKHITLIENGGYSITLSGGQTYKVYIGTGQTGPSRTYSLDIPENVATLTANFPP